jgi:hypothetical protein
VRLDNGAIKGDPGGEAVWALDEAPAHNTRGGSMARRRESQPRGGVTGAHQLFSP